MSKREPAELRPWMLFALPAAIVVPITAAFVVGGPVMGLPVAALIVIVIVVVAIRLRPDRENAARADAGDDGWRRAAARRFAVPMAIAVAGIVMVTATEDTARIIGWGVVAVAVTVATSLVFLEIGYSEDRARAREQRAQLRSRSGRGGPREVR